MRKLLAVSVVVVFAFQLSSCGVPGFHDAPQTGASPKATRAIQASVDFRVGFLALDEADYETAVTKFQASAKAGDARGQFALGQLYDYGIGVPHDPKEAQRWYDKAKHDSELLADTAYNYGAVGRFLTQTRRMIEVALIRRPDDPTYLATYALILYNSGEYEAAAVQFQKALTAAPKGPPIENGWSERVSYTGWISSRGGWRNSRDLYWRSGQVFRGAGDAYWKSGQPEIAREHWAKHLRLLEQEFPRVMPANILNSWHATILSANAIDWADDEINLEQALGLARQTVDAYPKHQRHVNALAWVHFKMENFTEAVALYETLVELSPRESFYRRKLGNAYWQSGLPYSARAMWQEALALAGKDDPKVLNKFARTWAVNGWNLDEARELCERMLRLRPKVAPYLDTAGLVEYKAGDYQVARQYFERAIELDPYNPYYRSRLGDSLWQVGEHDVAQTTWREASEIPWIQPKLARELKAKLASRSSRGAGSSNEPSRGSGDAGGWPRISRKPLPAPRPGSSSPTSASLPDASQGTVMSNRISS